MRCSDEHLEELAVFGAGACEGRCGIGGGVRVALTHGRTPASDLVALLIDAVYERQRNLGKRFGRPSRHPRRSDDSRGPSR